MNLLSKIYKGEKLGLDMLPPLDLYRSGNVRPSKRFVIPYNALTFSAKEKVDGILFHRKMDVFTFLGMSIPLYVQSTLGWTAGGLSAVACYFSVVGLKIYLERFRAHMLAYKPYDRNLGINKLFKYSFLPTQKEDLRFFLRNNDDWEMVINSYKYFDISFRGSVILSNTRSIFGNELPLENE